MGKSQAAISRKTFLKLASLACLAGNLPRYLSLDYSRLLAWPMMSRKQLPERMDEILELVPPVEVDWQGFMILKGNRGSEQRRIPVAQTQWNREHSNRWDRLDRSADWGIVLHWYGDEVGFDRTVEGYLRGFDEIRKVDDYITRTSSHFLIGSEFPVPGPGSDHESITILQTQLPDADGRPFTASHLKQLDYLLHQEKRQYFVRALYELGYRQPTVHSILQDWFDGKHVDANTRSLAIELTGCYFDSQTHSPTNQQIANVVGVVWALMRRYSIKASNILGHNEIQLDKSDPGKRFMALIRLLVGAKALTDVDPVMNDLIFGQYLDIKYDPALAVRIYFEWVRDYLVLVSQPSQAATWEMESGYWSLFDKITDQVAPVSRR
jgi:hypothetical protein